MFIPNEFQFPTILNNLRKNVGGYTFKNGVLLLDAPGFSKDDINIDIDSENNIMHIYGEKEILGEKYELDKKFTVPNYYLNSSEPIKAKVENGLIQIQLTRNEKKQNPKVVIS